MDISLAHLKNQDLDAFYPKIRVQRVIRGRKQWVLRPMFPNYLFAHMAYPDDYYKVIWAKGVRRIVGNGAEPLPLDDAIVDFFKQQTEESL